VSDGSGIPGGAGQWIVVYTDADTGNEIDPGALYSQIAADAAIRREAGQRIVSMAAEPLRHAAAYLGRQGSGYETKMAVAVVYATV
jgi:hypothetical protein